MTSEKLIQFRNCKILRNHEIISDDIWVRNGVIVNPEKIFFDEKNLAHQQIDCKGAVICPGFIELQINGECKISNFKINNFSYKNNLSLLWMKLLNTKKKSYQFLIWLKMARGQWTGFFLLYSS